MLNAGFLCVLSLLCVLLLLPLLMLWKIPPQAVQRGDFQGADGAAWTTHVSDSRTEVC